MNPEPPVAQSFWKKYFCQPSDPLAGQWKHELLGRAGWMALSGTVFILIVLFCEKLQIREKYYLPFLFGVFAGVPEVLLRKSWKIGTLTMALGVVSCAFAFYMTPNESSDYWTSEFSNLLVSLGVSVALGAGLGARSL